MVKHRNLRAQFLIATAALAGFFAIAVVVPAASVFAQGAQEQTQSSAQVAGQPAPGDVGLKQIQQTSGLGGASFGSIIAKIIRIFLTLMGVITIGVLIYGGFTYMTAGGSEESIDKAKRILLNGVIGLVIVFSSFAISEFIIRSFLNATGATIDLGVGSGGDPGIASGSGIIGGSSGTGFGALTVKFISPKGTQQFSNIKVNVVFNQSIDDSSVSYGNNFIVTNKAGEKVEGTVKVDGDTLTFTPKTQCAAPNTSLNCFTADTYTVTLIGGKKESIRSVLTSKILSCTSNCTTTFIPGTTVDTSSPVISNTKPLDNAKIPGESFVPIEALLSDNNGIAYGKIYVDGKLMDTVEATKPPSGTGQELFIQSKKFATKGDKIGQQRVITITATDISGNTGKADVKTTTYAPHCFNKVKDADELDIDCSPPNGECGLCTNGTCGTTSQCAAYSFCDPVKKICVSSPRITDVQPRDGAPGTFVTVTGEGFGTNSGFVTFLGDPKDDTDDKAAGLACTAGWSFDQAVVLVPDGAKSGPIRVKNLAGSTDDTDNQTGLFLKEFAINETVRPGICGLTPASGLPGSQVKLFGTKEISSPSVERKLFFGGYIAKDIQWAVETPNTIKATVPDADPGFVTVQATIKGVLSNPLTYLVTKLGDGAGASGSGSGSGAAGSSSAASVLKLDTVDPLSGGAGTYITLTGTGFGSVPNKVYFVQLDAAGKPTGEQVVASTNFPAQCAATFWTNKQIIVKVPEIPLGKYGVAVYPVGKKDGSNLQTFTVTAQKPGPQVCAIKADTGPANGTLVVTMYGEGFGSSVGGAIFSDKIVGKATGLGGEWTPTQASLIVPEKTASGPVRLALTDPKTIAGDFCEKNPASCSNKIFFGVVDCRVTQNSCAAGTMCCADGTCSSSCSAAGTKKKMSAAFLWCFSTGDSCEVSKPPEIKEECAKTGDPTKVIPSPSPSSVWSAPGSACSNGMIAVKFTENIDPASVSISKGSTSSIVVEKCIGDAADPCAKTDPALVLLKNLKISPYDAKAYSSIFVTPGQLNPKSTYRVSVANNITGIDSGLPIRAPSVPQSPTCKPGTGFAYCFTFSTGPTNEPCTIDVVGVTPTTFTANNFGPLLDAQKKQVAWFPTPYPADHCQILDASAYKWAWSPAKLLDTNFAVAAALSPDGAETPFVGKTPTKDNQFIDVTATTMQNGEAKSGKAALAINPGPPSIYERCAIGDIRSPSPWVKWPNSDAVCRHPLISVTFNNPVVIKKADGSDAPFTFDVYECTGTKAGKECETVVTTGPLAASLQLPLESDPEKSTYTYTLTPKDPLALNTWYVGEVSASTKVPGPNGKLLVPMTGCRTGVGYCFTFKTAPNLPANEEACKLTSIEVSPSQWTAKDYGIQHQFNAAAELKPLNWIANPFGANPCVYLQQNIYSFAWGIDLPHAGYAAIDPENQIADTLWYQLIAAYKETVGSPLSIFASSQGVVGSAPMTIKFTNPRIVSFDPVDCPGSTTGVCLNAQLAITFNTNMDLLSFKDNMFVYQCSSTKDFDKDTCDVADGDLKNALNSNAVADLQNSHRIVFPLNGGFQPMRKYRILLKNGARSQAGLPLAENNYPVAAPKYFSWTFVTGQKACTIDKVTTKPVDAVAGAQGQAQQFSVAAFGQADACHPNGQPLDSTAYTWNWSSSDTQVAQSFVASTTPQHAFTMIAKGAVIGGYQTAQITASALGKSDTVPWKLQCNATVASCPAGTRLGKDGCCYVQPGITKVYPEAGSSSICRNTLIQAYVGDLIDPQSVSSTSFMIGYKANAVTCTGGDFTDGKYCFKKFPYTLTATNQSNEAVKGITTKEALITASVGTLLPANSEIKVRVSKTTPADSVNAEDAVVAETGVPITGKTWTFVTGKNPCELDKVTVYPKNIIFTQLNKPAEAFAFGISKQGNFEVPIASIAGEYDWTWIWLPVSTKVAKVKANGGAQKVSLEAGGNNGKTFVSALATVTTDKYFTPSTVGKKIASQLTALAMLCEVPWFADAQDSLKGVLDAQHLSFWYCESPKGKKMLPHLTPVVDQVADTAYTVLNAFHLVDPVGGGAIGFRIEKNLKHYSPLEWYYQKEFKGDVQPITVAGLDGVRVGNTLYLAFGSAGGASTYTNMLIMSLSDPVAPEMQAIFDDIVANLQTATNLSDEGLCYQNGQPSDTQCMKDAECNSTPQKILTNDERADRVFIDPKEDLAVIGEPGYVFGISCLLDLDAGAAKLDALKYDLDTHKFSAETTPKWDQVIIGPGIALAQKCKNTTPSGTCSINSNKAISCYADSDCPTGIICVLPTAPTACNVPYTKFIRDTNRVIDTATFTRSLIKAQAFAGKYPIMASGSFVPGLVSSAWSQWGDFMTQLGIAQVVDPINAYVGCSGDYESATCWSAQAKKYKCSTGSEVYHYKTVSSGANYELGVTFEQDASLTNKWAGDITTILSDKTNKVNTNFCTGNLYTPDSVCGDGAIGGKEQCDPVGATVTVNSTEKDPATGNAICPYGTCTSVCTAQCTLGPLVAVNKCGDGVIQGPEKCDDGKNFNGKYNHCPADCGVKTGAVLSDFGSCGDGKLQSNEMCDIGTTIGRTFITGAGVTAQIAGKTETVYTGFTCMRTPTNNFKSTAFYSVENRVVPYNSYAVNSNGSTELPESYMVTLKGVGTPHILGDICSNKNVPASGSCSQYPLIACFGSADCPNSSPCAIPAIGSKYAFDKANSCNWDCKASGPYCGDLTVNAEGGEQCDGDQNDGANNCTRKCDVKTCLWAKTAADGSPVCEQNAVAAAAAPVGCGDAKPNSAVGEECDSGTDPSKLSAADQKTKPSVAGGQNGIACTPLYGQNNTCQYCTLSCKKAFVTGGYCGDGIKNGNEACDKNDVVNAPSLYQYGTHICKSDCSGIIGLGKPQENDEIAAFGVVSKMWWTATVKKIDNNGVITEIQFADGVTYPGPDNGNSPPLASNIALIGSKSADPKETTPFIVGMRVGVRQAKVAKNVGFDEAWKIGYITAIKSDLYDVKFEDGTTTVGQQLKNIARIPDVYLSCFDQTKGWNGFAGSAPIKLPKTAASKISFSFSDPTLQWLPVKMGGEIHFDNEGFPYQAIGSSNGFQFTSFPTNDGNVMTNVTTDYLLDKGPLIGMVSACYGTTKQYQASFGSEQIFKLYSGNFTQFPNAPFKNFGGAFSYTIPQMTLAKPDLGQQQLQVEPEGKPGDYRFVITGIESVNKQESFSFTFGSSPQNQALSTNSGSITCSGNGWVDSNKNVYNVTDPKNKTAAIVSLRDGCVTTKPYTQIESAVALDAQAADIVGSRMFVLSFTSTALMQDAQLKNQVYQLSLSKKIATAGPVKIAVWYRGETPSTTGKYWKLVGTMTTSQMVNDGNENYYALYFWAQDGVKNDPASALYKGKYSAAGPHEILAK